MRIQMNIYIWLHDYLTNDKKENIAPKNWWAIYANFHMRITFHTAPLSALPCTSIPDQNLFQLHLSLPDFYFIGESLFHQFGNSNECVNLFYTMKFLWEICCSFFCAIFSFPNTILARHFSMTKAYFIIFFFVLAWLLQQ